MGANTTKTAVIPCYCTRKSLKIKLLKVQCALFSVYPFGQFGYAFESWIFFKNPLRNFSRMLHQIPISESVDNGIIHSALAQSINLSGTAQGQIVFGQLKPVACLHECLHSFARVGAGRCREEKAVGL